MTLKVTEIKLAGEDACGPSICQLAINGKKMIPNEDATELLFSYGTLRDEEVQLSTFGRKLDGSPDTLIGYCLAMIRIEDEHFVETSGTAHHRNLKFTGSESDLVEGTIFRVTMKELELADAYEPEGYKRVQATLKSGGTSWVYVNVIS